jgi:hypothetical protein
VTRRKRPGLSDWQKQLVGELKTLAQQRPDLIRVTKQPKLDSDGDAIVRISLHTADIPRAAGGLKLRDYEEFVLRIRPYLLLPPAIDVDHVRFLGFPMCFKGNGYAYTSIRRANGTLRLES